MGNGRVAMNGNGADIHQLFGPCYSVPGVMTLKLTDPSVKAENHRIQGSAGYITKLTDTATGAPVGELTDYSHPTEPVFIRRFNLHRPLSFALKSTFETTDTTDAFGSRAVGAPSRSPMAA